MEARCKKCGRPLRDPQSIARGMGPECAGLSRNSRRSLPARKQNGSSSACKFAGAGITAAPLFTWEENESRQTPLPDSLTHFPPDLVGLVLSAPPAGGIAAQATRHRGQQSGQKSQSPMAAVKEIRRMCIQLRLLFWPGFSFKGEPLACIPCGEDKWKIGQASREISTENLLSYLGRYGVI